MKRLAPSVWPSARRWPSPSPPNSAWGSRLPLSGGVQRPGSPPGPAQDPRGIPLPDGSQLAGDEYWLPVLAAKLRVKPIIVHRWRWSGWLSARQLRGDHGRWIVWADAAEIKRLVRLRAFEIEHPRRRPPTELTTPRQPKTSKRRNNA